MCDLGARLALLRRRVPVSYGNPRYSCQSLPYLGQFTKTAASPGARAACEHAPSETGCRNVLASYARSLRARTWLTARSSGSAANPQSFSWQLFGTGSETESMM